MITEAQLFDDALFVTAFILIAFVAGVLVGAWLRGRK